MSVCLFVYAHVWECPWRPGEGVRVFGAGDFNSWELFDEGVGTELWSSVRLESALNCTATSPALVLFCHKRMWWLKSQDVDQRNRHSLPTSLPTASYRKEQQRLNLWPLCIILSVALAQLWLDTAIFHLLGELTRKAFCCIIWYLPESCHLQTGQAYVYTFTCLIRKGRPGLEKTQLWLTSRGISANRNRPKLLSLLSQSIASGGMLLIFL